MIEPLGSELRRCPHCSGALAATLRWGHKIDICSGCGGVWLDRGELEKILERSYRNRALRYDDGGEEVEPIFVSWSVNKAG
ncbi:MAG: zf-TFIIB domain-containing protein [Planctomycetes bacterium]|nr:zf-TFIIB domain-containing protein [Planctomycetota bacterium]